MRSPVPGTGRTGSVLVVGGGISGIQSSLDLADAGFKVYLVDKGLSIGGTMPKLDKTFPTNDCSMCILAPKLVYTGRHKNVEIITNAEVRGVEGEVGNFKVTLKEHPRFVDLDICNGCGDCVEHCPVILPSEFDEGIGSRKAIYQPFPQAIPNIYAIDKLGERSPCRLACPAELNAHAFVTLASQERFAEAYHLIMQRVPLPGTLGRICYHPCETECNRKDQGGAVSICAIRRAIADHIHEFPSELQSYLDARKEHLTDREDPFALPMRGNGRKVAVVGAGPMGLTAALDLGKMGYEPIIFDASDRAGGMLQYGIPSYRLPKDYLQMEVSQLLGEGGIETRFDTRLGKDISISSLTDEGYEAILLGLGAQKSRGLDLEGMDSKDVLLGVDFLRKLNLGEMEKNHFKNDIVIVVGGGNVAIDVARSSLRLGAEEVHLVCLEKEEEMPAHRWEVQMALEEGVQLHTCLGPGGLILDEGRVRGLDCMECTSVFDKDRRFSPTFNSECKASIDGTKLIVAIGQAPEAAFLEKEGIRLTRGGWIDADRVTLQTSIPNVFAGGDIVSGPASAVEAIGAGHRAAGSIDRFLNGEDLREGRDVPAREGAPVPERTDKVWGDRTSTPMLPVHERIEGFHEVELTLPKEAAVAEALRCLSCSDCCECMQCVEHCQKSAIDHYMAAETRTIEVGAVILSPGFESYRPPYGDSLGYGLYPNVLTSIEFERMLSASGPYKGHVKRISDGKEPKKVAWLQCVGSRDESCDHLYCSSVCCMYAVKEAVIAKEHVHGLNTHIYFMDMRSFGKDFDKYYDRAENEYGVVFRRSRVPRIEQDRRTKDLTLRYIDEKGSVCTETYDMVVLSVGLQPCSALGDLSEAVDVNLNEYGFIETDPYDQVVTSRKGVYASGAVTEPKDIPESVTQASAAAARAAGDISGSRGTLVTVREYPREKDVHNEVPRIGVFICHCGINIGGVIDVKDVVEFARTQPYVVFADDETFTCSADSLERMRDRILEMGLNRVVVASCTPRTHEPLFQDTLKEAGLNPHLFEMVNLRDQNSWVHRNYPEMATRKAKESVRMGIAKVAELYAVSHHKVPVIPEALVIGGGIAGMSSAISMADQGFKVHLIERSGELGGMLRDIHLGIRNEDPQQLMIDTITKVMEHPLIDVHIGTELQEITGYVGNFTSRLRKGEASDIVQHGIVVVATGATEYEPTEYFYGKSDRVVRQKEFEKDLSSDKGYIGDLKEVVMIQCVGSRNDEHPYCSRICCTNALKNAVKLKERDPGVSVYVLYRDIRSYGFKEDRLYRKARELGVVFIHFEKGQEPSVSVKGGKVSVKVRETILGRNMVFHPDRLVLSTGMVPGDNMDLSQKLKVPMNADGFYSEAHMKLRPVDFSADGIFLCGTAHSPRSIEETILQAQATGARAATILSREFLETQGNVARVISRNCAGCKLCLQVCPYDAIDLDEDRKVVIVNEILCQGCGACAAVCPSGTSQQNSFTKKQIFAMIDACMR
ncbi:MAG: FAD-dependent oxidoreductase [Candidatus Thermoplasmatota archaeon]|nr:FAD-dependent oxidoreductase [Candidatus Thermoplasmatota archaeon]